MMARYLVILMLLLQGCTESAAWGPMLTGGSGTVTACSVPEIYGVTGTVSHGESIVISTGCCGTKSPAAPHFWDDFELETDGATVVSTDPPIGAWCENTTNWKYEDTYNSVAQPHANSTQYLMGYHQYDAGGQCRNNIEIGIKPSAEVPENILVVMYYLRLDPAWGSPPAGYCDDDGGIDRNYKEFWVQEKDNAEAWSCSCDQTTCYFGHDESFSSTEPWHYNSSDGDVCGSQINSVAFGGNPSQRWNHRFWIARNSTCYLDLGNLSTYNGGDATWISRSDSSDMFGSGGTHDDIWMINFGAYARYCADNDCFPDMRRYVDDLYVDYTFSRVLLGNASTGWDDCTILEPQIPSAWASDEITVTVNAGSLSAGTVYMYVFDSSNNVNSTGYSVTLE